MRCSNHWATWTEMVEQRLHMCTTCDLLMTSEVLLNFSIWFFTYAYIPTAISAFYSTILYIVSCIKQSSATLYWCFGILNVSYIYRRSEHHYISGEKITVFLFRYGDLNLNLLSFPATVLHNAWLHYTHMNFKSIFNVQYPDRHLFACLCSTDYFKAIVNISLINRFRKVVAC